MTGNVASWTNADVQRWLAGLGLPEETLGSFAKNSIDGGKSCSGAGLRS